MSVLPTIAPVARLAVLGVLASVAGFGVSTQAHHVPGDDHTGVIVAAHPPEASQTPPASGGIKAMYPTRAEAEAAAPLFGCEGAHAMGQEWMPCAMHHEGHAGH
ncbi:MAG: DUF3721 domain-containing protein [Synechococcus sp.]